MTFRLFYDFCRCFSSLFFRVSFDSATCLTAFPCPQTKEINSNDIQETQFDAKFNEYFVNSLTLQPEYSQADRLFKKLALLLLEVFHVLGICKYSKSVLVSRNSLLHVSKSLGTTSVKSRGARLLIDLYTMLKVCKLCYYLFSHVTTKFGGHSYKNKLTQQFQH